ncbi:MAG TPA: YwiC-like family protein [Candidatus Methylomirabilis sp.]|nr:YwiC-like family protein [Candidatus Methylomirabilis sp.]
MNLRRMGKPVVPKEHGAWAVLYGAFFAGVGVARTMNLPVLLLLVGVTAAAFANGALTILLRSATGPAHATRRRRALAWFLVYASLAVAALAPLLLVFRMTFLIPFGMGAGLFLVLRGFMIRGRGDRSLVGELTGTAGLTMVGPIAHAVAVGEVRLVGTVLWLLLFLFFSSGVFHVRARLQAWLARRKGGESARAALVPCLVYHVLLILVIPLLAILQILPWPTLLAFAPAVWRAAVGLRQDGTDLDLVRLGWSEVVLSTAFVVLLIVAFRLPLAS